MIHFSGHASKAGIVLRSDDGGYTQVSGPNLKRFFEDRGIKLVVLNACYTKSQGEHVGSAVDAIVGTTNAVEDEAGAVSLSRFIGHWVKDTPSVKRLEMVVTLLRFIIYPTFSGVLANWMLLLTPMILIYDQKIAAVCWS